jgi:hypothetical protein
MVTAQAVVERIEIAFRAVDRLTTQATSARTLIDHLDQALLVKAFRGELVPQDPNDEPASALLERIRASRQVAPAQGARKGGARVAACDTLRPYQAEQDSYEANQTIALNALPQSLPELVFAILAPLYELFQFFQLPKRLVEEELASLQRSQF